MKPEHTSKEGRLNPSCWCKSTFRGLFSKEMLRGSDCFCRFLLSNVCVCLVSPYLHGVLVPAKSAALVGGGDMSQILDDFLCVLCFSSP